MKIKNFDSAGGASPLPYKLTIHKNPLSHTNPSKNRTIPRKSPTHLPLNERSVCFASLPRQPLVPLHQIPPLSKTTINPNRKASKRIPAACFGNGDSVLYIGFPLSISHIDSRRRGFGCGITRAVKRISADRNSGYFAVAVKRQRIAVIACRAA